MLYQGAAVGQLFRCAIKLPQSAALCAGEALKL